MKKLISDLGSKRCTIYLFKIHVISQFVLNNTYHTSLDLDERCTCNLGFGCARVCGLG